MYDKKIKLKQCIQYKVKIVRLFTKYKMQIKISIITKLNTQTKSSWHSLSLSFFFEYKESKLCVPVTGSQTLEM